MDEPRGRAVVFTPSPLVTVTIEGRPDGEPEIHLHAGGQGVWIARMLARLGVAVQVCAPFGGEAGPVVCELVRREGVAVRAVHASGNNGGYVHDRRAGERTEVAAVAPPVLGRHDLDALCNAVLVEGLDADVVVLGGPDDPRVVSPSTYRRLASDLSGKGVPVVADLTGAYLTEAVAGGVAVAKASHEDLVADGLAKSADVDDLRHAATDLVEAGARTAVVSRAGEPALALTEGRWLEVRAPAFERVDHRGAGDSMTAGIAAALASHAAIEDALRLGAAAGALNTTRRGLATGESDLIERLAHRVTVRPYG